MALMPSLGPLQQGHMLLVPLTHVTSLVALPESLDAEVSQAYDATRRFLTQHFGQPVCFEHGSGGNAGSGGWGVEQAHVHLVPLPEMFGGLTPPATVGPWERVESSASRWLTDLRALTDRFTSYLYFEPQGGAGYTAAVTRLPSQFMRRWLAESQSTKDWNWREWPQPERVAELVRWMRTVQPPEGFRVLEAPPG